MKTGSITAPIANSAIYPKSQRNVGFTMVEVLMVILVIAVLTGLILGIAGLANKKAANSKAQGELQLLANEFENYRLELGLYPDVTGNSWSNFYNSTSTNKYSEAYENIESEIYKNMVMDTPYLDPWGNSYQYKIPVKSGYQLELRSVGPDGRVGASYDGDNIQL